MAIKPLQNPEFLFIPLVNTDKGKKLCTILWPIVFTLLAVVELGILFNKIIKIMEDDKTYRNKKVLNLELFQSSEFSAFLY